MINTPTIDNIDDDYCANHPAFRHQTPKYITDKFKKLWHTKEVNGYEQVSSITKIYPSFVKVFIYDQSQLRKIEGYEQDGKKVVSSGQASPFDFEENYKRSLRRTKTNITDLAISNEFNMFATFTFNCRNCKTNCTNYIKGNKCICPPDQCLRNDVDVCKKRMAKWLANQVVAHGKFNYLIVPEYHKKCNKCVAGHVKICVHDQAPHALHFHALFGGYNGTLTVADSKINGRDTFNISGYRLGFNSIVSIDNIDKVGSYIKKYITKDMPRMNGKNRYWCSQGLKRPLTLNNFNIVDNPFMTFTKTYRGTSVTIYECRDTMMMQHYFNSEELLLWQSLSKSTTATNSSQQHRSTHLQQLTLLKITALLPRPRYSYATRKKQAMTTKR